MIDEELYQRATDELNSDRRKPKLWAKACALASDDHDEARFLYTNLRVEEMLEERRNPGQAKAPEPPAAPVDDGTLSLSLEDPTETSPTASVRPGTDHTRSIALELPEVPLAPTVDTAPAPESEHTPMKLDLDPDKELDFSIVEKPAAEPTAALGSDEFVDKLAAGASDHQETESWGGKPGSTDDNPDEFAWLDEAVVSEEDAGSIATATDGPHELAPIDVAAQEVVPQAAAPALSAANAQRLANDADRLFEDSPTDSATATSASRVDYADPADLDALLDEDEPQDDETDTANDLTTGRGKPWVLYETHTGSLRAIKRGVSWGALFLTFPWLLFRGLVGTAISYALVWATSLGGLVLSALAWFDAGNDASVALKATCAAFALIAFVALIVLPFFRANRWREGQFVKRGYRKLAKVRARNADEAVGRWRRAT